MIAQAILILTTNLFAKALSNRIDLLPDESQPALIIAIFLLDAATKILVTGPDILEQSYPRLFDRFRFPEERAHPRG